MLAKGAYASGCYQEPESVGRRNWPEAVAQENERQKKVGLPDSTNNRRERDKPRAMCEAKEKSRECV